MTWQNQDRNRWFKEQESARRIMSDLEVGVTIDGEAVIRGTLRVLTEHDHEVGNFRLRIEYPWNFPRRGAVPRVYLDSHREEWKPGGDSHIEPDWRLCLFVAGTSRIDFERDDSMEMLLVSAASFLLKEYLYQKKLQGSRIEGELACFPGRDRAHGVPGLRAAWDELGRPRGNRGCICGSGKKIKHCCLKSLRRAINEF